MYIPFPELELRLQRIGEALQAHSVGSILLRSIPNHLYLTGSVYSGYTYVAVGQQPLFFYDRPTSLFNNCPYPAMPIRKPEQIPALLAEYGLTLGADTVVERSFLPQAEYARLEALTTAGFSPVDGSALMRKVRSIKTPYELEEIRAMAKKHMEIYRLAPQEWSPGDTDTQWLHKLEYQMRTHGSIGTFRAFGARMEIFMGNLSAGANADTPAPYDFALGGAGVPAMPMSANGTQIQQGMPVMVDLAGNYGVYNTDITRVYAWGKVAPHLQKAHDLSIALQHWMMTDVAPGTTAAEIYNHCAEQVSRAGLQNHFMGMSFQSKFVGHGVGIEINELPVLTPRDQTPLQPGMVIALEPKFVFPEGAVGVENTFEVTPNGMQNLTDLPMDIIPLC